MLTQPRATPLMATPTQRGVAEKQPKSWCYRSVTGHRPHTIQQYCDHEQAVGGFAQAWACGQMALQWSAASKTSSWAHVSETHIYHNYFVLFMFLCSTLACACQPCGFIYRNLWWLYEYYITKCPWNSGALRQWEYLSPGRSYGTTTVRLPIVDSMTVFGSCVQNLTLAKSVICMISTSLIIYFSFCLFLLFSFGNKNVYVSLRKRKLSLERCFDV